MIIDGECSGRIIICTVEPKPPILKPDKSHKKVRFVPVEFRSLYFIRCGDAVKIGVASNIKKRIGVLQTGAPGRLELLAVIPNAGHREAECHQKLRHIHIHGEWFRDGQEVIDLIKEIQGIFTVSNQTQ